ncbi:MAG: rod shape-determining protein RodA, partial [Rhodobacteraceae bacterium]|nr:rod shape-determining protein RodA [Paracoccaceae bacterium]
MSYLEYRVRSVPTGMRKILYLNWPLTILIISAAGFGFLMLYSVAGGSLRPWAEPQMKRFALGFLIMLVIAMTPIWAWRNLSFVGYALSLILLLLVEL